MAIWTHKILRTWNNSKEVHEQTDQGQFLMYENVNAMEFWGILLTNLTIQNIQIIVLTI